MIKKKKTSRQISRETRAKLKKLGRRNRKFVHIVCIRCKRETNIRIHPKDIDLYTDKLRKNFVCLLCKGGNTWYERLKKKGLI